MPFLLGDPRIRAALMKYHADLFTAEFWQARKERIQHGQLEDVFPYRRRSASPTASAPCRTEPRAGAARRRRRRAGGMTLVKTRASRRLAGARGGG